MPRYIEKLRVPVRLALVGCKPVEGHFSVSPQADLHDGPETLLERLNAPTRVLPFARAGDGAVLLVLRAHIESVAVDRSVAPALVSPAHFMHTREEQVEVRLLGGRQHKGVLAIEMPHEFNRVSDFLNADGEFFPLQSREGTTLVNKACLLDVRVQVAGALPRVA